MKNRESYKDFMRRAYNEMRQKQKQRVDDTNPLLLRIQSLEKRIEKLEKKD